MVEECNGMHDSWCICGVHTVQDGASLTYTYENEFISEHRGASEGRQAFSRFFLELLYGSGALVVFSARKGETSTILLAQSCIRSGDPHAKLLGELKNVSIHALCFYDLQVWKVGLNSNMFVLNALMDVYAKISESKSSKTANHEEKMLTKTIPDLCWELAQLQDTYILQGDYDLRGGPSGYAPSLKLNCCAFFLLRLAAARQSLMNEWIKSRGRWCKEMSKRVLGKEIFCCPYQVSPRIRAYIKVHGVISLIIEEVIPGTKALGKGLLAI
ncbi:hypothetical protein VNO77_31491 [Canavalia gladiata]|uniref:Uncharacterized protein n=1 Tax=Canavalia gladiata TaxID=3824 RepID=A0AAN9KNX8_CANGL